MAAITAETIDRGDLEKLVKVGDSHDVFVTVAFGDFGMMLTGSSW